MQFLNCLLEYKISIRKVLFTQKPKNKANRHIYKEQRISAGEPIIVYRYTERYSLMRWKYQFICRVISCKGDVRSERYCKHNKGIYVSRLS